MSTINLFIKYMPCATNPSIAIQELWQKYPYEHRYNVYGFAIQKSNIDHSLPNKSKYSYWDHTSIVEQLEVFKG